MGQPVTRPNGDQTKSLFHRFRGANVAIVGGGQFCLKLIRFLREQDLASRKPNIIGVADINPKAKGLQYARQLGIFTTADFRELYSLHHLEMILEITLDPDLAARIQETKPGHVDLLDHFHARNLWDALRVENLRLTILEELQPLKHDPVAVEKLLEKSFDSFDQIIVRRNARSRQIEMELVENQRTQSQIIQGSTIPTFVINKDHIVTHWNKALEALSGSKAEDIVGTNRQWAPFWQQERPTMADVILDQIDEEAIHQLYGRQWRKSSLIEDGYEAEIFFSQVGATGKWIWFTAAPIKGPDGAIVGAIETLWDKTEDKRSEEDRERHTAELAALLVIYTALSAPLAVDLRIQAALKEVERFFGADEVNIFLHTDTNGFSRAYSHGSPHDPSGKTRIQPPAGLIEQVAQTSRLVLIESLEAQTDPQLAAIAQKGFRSLSLIPISAKGKKAIGVLLMASCTTKKFDSGELNVLDLIGNRIGVAIENAMLQTQYIKSEEKYRSLFNNDPSPIFIIDQKTLDIIDINERTTACYGYSRAELIGTPFMRLADTNDTEVRNGLSHLRLGKSILFSKKRHHRKDGRLFYVNINAGHAQYGESDVLIATTTDISETVQKETQLIQASKMTTLGLMAAGMAHEINQPLNVIQICADVVLKTLKRGRTIPENELSTLAKDIVANVERATGIIRHVRHFARQSEVIKSKIDINAPIRDAFKVLGHQLKAHQIALDLDLAREMPLIMADHNRLEQVFINLVTNAIDAMDEKAERPEHKSMEKKLVLRTYDQNDKVIATVQDNGIGMSEEVQQKLFEPFFTTKQIGKGTGLGVSISYGIVKDYDGTIAIQSRVGHGTTFILTFPVTNDAF